MKTRVKTILVLLCTMLTSLIPAHAALLSYHICPDTTTGLYISRSALWVDHDNTPGYFSTAITFTGTALAVPEPSAIPLYVFALTLPTLTCRRRNLRA